MHVRTIFAYLFILAFTLVPGSILWEAPLAAQDAGDDGDDGDPDGGDGDDGDVEDPDDQDPGGDDGGDGGGDDLGGDDLGGDDVGAGDPGGGDDAGSDDGAGGSTDDDGGAAGGDDDDGAAGGSDDDGGAGGDDDDGGTDDIPGDGGDNDDTGGDDDGEDLGAWEVTAGETEADRAALDERDRIGTDRDGFRYRRSEFVAFDLSNDDVAELRRRGFEIVASEDLKTVDGTLLLLRGPAQTSDEDALEALETLADPDNIGFNHLFDSAAVQTTRKRGRSLPQRQACGCEIGLIDTAVATSLSAFTHVSLTQRAFNGKTAAPRLHGTAVAQLMAGTKGNQARGTKIFVADIFSGPRETSGSSFALVKALDWLAAQGVPVINISLSGPRNQAVASAIARVTKRGHVIVAAAGNDGPAAPPVFPGAYDGVLGVTAVDAQNRVYRYANRGTHVDFAARGVAVPTIDAKGDVRDATGTSFAAPIIAARLAGQLRKPDSAAAQKAIRALEAQARDLGPRGRDPIYGAGLIGSDE